jgi:hypothetical protein
LDLRYRRIANPAERDGTVDYTVPSNHSGWHENNINIWLPMLEKAIAKKKK